jgi:hypothetical protein
MASHAQGRLKNFVAQLQARRAAASLQEGGSGEQEAAVKKERKDKSAKKEKKEKKDKGKGAEKEPKVKKEKKEKKSKS